MLEVAALTELLFGNFPPRVLKAAAKQGSKDVAHGNQDAQLQVEAAGLGEDL